MFNSKSVGRYRSLDDGTSEVNTFIIDVTAQRQDLVTQMAEIESDIDSALKEAADDSVNLSERLKTIAQQLDAIWPQIVVMSRTIYDGTSNRLLRQKEFDYQLQLKIDVTRLRFKAKSPIINIIYLSIEREFIIATFFL